MAKKPAPRKAAASMPQTAVPALLKSASKDSVAISPLTGDSLKAWLKKQDKRTQRWVEAAGFDAKAGSMLLLPDANGDVSRVLWGVGDTLGLYSFAALPNKLPANKGGYYIDHDLTEGEATNAALGWLLGSYKFTPYKKSAGTAPAQLVMPKGADAAYVADTAAAVYLVRDLVNFPPNDFGPAEIAQAGQKVARSFNSASIKTIVGDDLLKQNYPMIHAVGRGSARAPRLIDLRWGKKGNPKITLVGKGVAFDTGGLDIKPSSGMALMKKDMGGAAHVLGLAQMIMAAKLPVDLRVLIPAVENSVDGNSFRTSDVIKTRNGMTVEIGNTDAEGRLILCDALTEACADKPDLIMDFATLTGAARVALGPDLPAMFSNDDSVANDLLAAAATVEDPLWRLPLWQPYKDALGSKIADTNHIGGQAGAITAALFLEKFITAKTPWVHIDTFSWNNSDRPGRPAGGEALGMRASFALIQQRYGHGKKSATAKKKTTASKAKGPKK